MTHGYHILVTLSLISVLFTTVIAARYEDCERPPSVSYATIRVEDEETAIRAIYTCLAGYELRGSSEVVCDLDRDEWITELPACIRQSDSNGMNAETTNKRRKQSDTVEDRSVSAALATTLDMSCVQAKVKAPEIRHGYVEKYDRRRKGDKIFLVASYSCNENFEFEDSEINTLYCSDRRWIGELPVCISLGQYVEEEDEEEYGEYDNGEEDDGEDDGVISEKTPKTVIPSPSTAMPASESLPSSSSEVEHGLQEDLIQLATEANVVVEPTQDPYTPRVLDEDCGSNKGGCSQNCERLLYPGENEPRLRCSCHEGFSLDPYDYSTCQDINECLIDNGGCQQVCENLPGSFQCTCKPGYQIDTFTGTACIDINECENPKTSAECTAGCVNTPGSYQCIATNYNAVEENDLNHTEISETTQPAETLECMVGYRAHGGRCVDIDECSEMNHDCEICLNTEGSFQCSCSPGFDLASDNKTCLDIDECSIVVEYNEDEAPSRLCSHYCENTMGGFVCNCPPKYHLFEDLRTCVRDTCADLKNLNLNKTQCSYDCIDLLDGSYECLCPESYKLSEDGFTCSLVEDICSHSRANELCYPGTCQPVESRTSFNCICPIGFVQNNYSCVDIDECTERSHKCSHDCINIEGDYRCSCPEGFKFRDNSTKECEDVDECQFQENICDNLRCVNYAGGFNCLCHDGSEPDENTGICASTIEDPCASHPCSHECTPDGQNFRCTCPENMTLDVFGENCVVLDLCSISNNGCEHICNSDAEGRCSCHQGFTLDHTGKSCVDIDECEEKNGGCHHLCTNFAGGFNCSCYQGFDFLDEPLKNYCFDVDECITGVHTCLPDTICENLNGSFTCVCPQGYAVGLDLGHSGLFSYHNLSLNSSYSPACLDIDECSIDNGNCSHFCINLPGNHECSCSPGYVLSTENNRSCFLVDACLQQNGGCSHNCQYVNGQAECSCPKGLHLDSDQKTCLDTDECLLTNNSCDHVCENLFASYACSCRRGFTLASDNHSCLDINECAEKFDNCSVICINILGSYICACEPGYELAEDQRTCLDVNECLFGQHDCSHECINVEGGFECSCPEGYYLGSNRSLCLDIDECSTIDHGCSHDCVNTMGSYECICPSGFGLTEDGKSCMNTACLVNNGGCSHFCSIEIGCNCPAGWALQDDRKTCYDINECLYNNGGCDFKCINTDGAYECLCFDDSQQRIGESCPPVCPAGYTVNPNDPSKCVDIDECLAPDVCEFTCLNTNGSYDCLCPLGYRLADGNRCVDIDECEENNGGCVGGQCLNYMGSFECKCATGYRLGHDLKTCEKHIELRDECPIFEPPENAEIHCTKYRHKQRFFYNTRCKIWCKQGYRLVGPSQRYCNASGQWDDYQNLCLPVVCPRLSHPMHGILLPQSCTTGRTYMGERCRLQCNAGYVPVGKSVTICTQQMQWSYNDPLDCKPKEIETHTGSSNGFTPFPLPTVSTYDIATTFNKRPISGVGLTTNIGDGEKIRRPYIKCPRNTTVFLHGVEKTAHVVLQKPLTNMDYRYIESSPAWTKDLETHLSAGTHVVIFRGYDPLTGRRARCKTVIHVRYAESPQAIFCTPSFEVTLGENQSYRSVVWDEPRFEARIGAIRKIYKSRLPGELFSSGVHKVFYEATSEDGLVAQCEFKITVKKYSPSQESQLNLNKETGYKPAGEHITMKTSDFPANSFATKETSRSYPSGENTNLPAQTEFKRNMFLSNWIQPVSKGYEASVNSLQAHSPNLYSHTKANDNIEPESPKNSLDSILETVYSPPSTATTALNTINQISTPIEPAFTLYHSNLRPDYNQPRSYSTLVPSNTVHTNSGSIPTVHSSSTIDTMMTKAHLLPGHESFIICPGEEPVKVTNAKSVELPTNCILKNVRHKSFRQFVKRRSLAKIRHSYGFE
uniref:Fibrillin-2 n=1 Tax=Glossina brevipalpis TaxID=37001 RepID=A0A1A9W7Q2_9MUSC